VPKVIGLGSRGVKTIPWTALEIADAEHVCRVKRAQILAHGGGLYRQAGGRYGAMGTVLGQPESGPGWSCGCKECAKQICLVFCAVKVGN